MKKLYFFTLLALLIFTSACGQSSNPSNTTKNSPRSTDTLPVQATQTVTPLPPSATPTPLPPTPTPTINPQPVSIEEGLASLNSYTLNVIVKMSSDTQPKLSLTITIGIQHSSDPDATSTHIVMNGGSGVTTNSSNLDETIYVIGNDQCVDDKNDDSTDDFSYQSNLANMNDMITAMWNMVSVVPVITDPKFVGEETVNNIPTYHYTFSVPGLAAKSGAEITTNQGDYWLAKDGRYIVKGNMVTETRGAPTSQIVHYEGNLDLTDINQPINITLPKPCINIKNKTQTPTP